jgi:hypothetical protein
MSTSLAALAFSLGTVCVDLSPLILGEHRTHIFAAAAAVTYSLHLAHLIIAQAKAFLHSSHAIAAASAAFTLALAVSILMLRFTALLVPGKSRRGQQCHQRDDNNHTFHVPFSFNWQTKFLNKHTLAFKFGANMEKLNRRPDFRSFSLTNSTIL